MSDIDLTVEENVVVAIEVAKQGPSGPQGIQGEQGDQGDQGDQGIQGDTGAQGDTGDTGEQGISGDVTTLGTTVSGNFASFTTTSGNEIEDSGYGPDDYYTGTEIDTISGSLQDQITNISIESVEEFTLDVTDISNKYVDLSVTPTANDEILIWVYGGLKGLYNTNYTVSGTRISWDSKDWDGILESGDVLSTLCWY